MVRLHPEPALGKPKLVKIRPRGARSFIGEKLAEGLTPKTVKHFRDGLIVRNAAALAKRAVAGTRWVESESVFTTTIGTMLARRSLLRAFYRILPTPEVPRIRFHGLRPSAATLLLAQDVHPGVAMDLPGHPSIAVTLDT